MPRRFQLGAIGRLGRFSASHARAVAIAWIVVAVGLGFLAPRVETALSGAGWEATGSDSVAARTLIQQHFAGNASTGLMVVLHSPSLRSSDASFAAVTAKTAALVKGDPAVTGVTLPAAGRLDQPRRPYRDRDRPARRVVPSRWCWQPTA